MVIKSSSTNIGKGTCKNVRTPTLKLVFARMLAPQHSSQYLQDVTEHRGIKDIPWECMHIYSGIWGITV
jgi:hypothetical protein